MDIIKHYAPKFNFLKSLIKNDTPSILEIGAHYGEDTLRLSQTFPQSTIYCFEPDPRNITIFKKYIKDENIFLFELALSNKDGEADFFLSYQESSGVPSKYDWISPEEYDSLQLNNSGSSSLKKGYQHILPSPTKVSTLRFDNWYKKHQIGKIDFAWVDVQGSEKDVIEGIGKEIENIKYIWMEYGEQDYEGGMSWRETVDLLKTKNFIEIRTDSSGSKGDILFKNNK